MKIILLLTLILFVTLGPFADPVVGNPFSCKLQQNLPQIRSSKSLTKLTYKGYAFIKKQKFAIIQIGTSQYTVKQQDKIDEIQVLEISPDFLTYRQNRRIHKVEIESKKSDF